MHRRGAYESTRFPISADGGLRATNSTTCSANRHTAQVACSMGTCLCNYRAPGLPGPSSLLRSSQPLHRFTVRLVTEYRRMLATGVWSWLRKGLASLQATNNKNCWHFFFPCSLSCETDPETRQSPATYSTCSKGHGCSAFPHTNTSPNAPGIYSGSVKSRGPQGASFTR